MFAAASRRFGIRAESGFGVGDERAAGPVYVDAAVRQPSVADFSVAIGGRGKGCVT